MRKIVQNVLHMYGKCFTNSPTAQLEAIQEMEGEAHRAPARQGKVEFWFTINTACTPVGFGTFQLVTGYTHGPQSVLFTLVNEKDDVDQDGQGKVLPSVSI